MTRYVVYGLGISGLSAIKFFAKNNEEVIATDDNFQSIEKAKSQLASEDPQIFQKVKFQLPDEIEYDAKTIISFAPGIPLYFPKAHKILEIVKKTGAKLACDLEIFYQKNCDENFIAITGTNGKSTTTALTSFVFKELGIDSEIGGNIGVPCFDIEANKKKTYILETSSYQLDLLSKSHFKIAALLNITPDHIDRHGSMENYIEAKKRIFRNQTAEDFALIDVDNENSHKVFDELKNDKNFKAKLVPISTLKIQENGVALIDGILFNKISKTAEKLELKSEFLRGKHNDQNMAFAFTIAYCFCLRSRPRHEDGVTLSEDGVTDLDTAYQGCHPAFIAGSRKEKECEEKIIAAIKKFHGLRHRMQILGKIDDMRFINDSKATNAESTENALKTYDNIFWILGGKAKEGGIKILQPYFNKITKAYLIGEASDDFAKTLAKNSVTFEKCGNLENAFKKAALDAKNNSLSEKNILLSPACASFDQWRNFEERGNSFCKLFDELQKS